MICFQVTLESKFVFFNESHDLSFSQAQANRGWSTSASTSASPATSACPCASTTFQSDSAFSLDPPGKRSGKQSCLFFFFFFGSLFKNKSELWLFPLCHTATSKPFSSFRERIELETGCHSYRQIPIITLFMYNTLSGGTLQRLKKKEPPLPLLCCKCL